MIDWLSMVLRLRQHSIGYMADGFYRFDDPTNIMAYESFCYYSVRLSSIVQVNADPKAKCLSYINLLLVDMGESEPYTKSSIFGYTLFYWTSIIYWTDRW